jgi:class 3 adenylate cyclase
VVTEPVALESELFFIAPIGEEGSEERVRSDGVFEVVVGGAAGRLGLSAIRADRLAESGLITTQIIRHLLYAKAAVADLTGKNPNVFYELAIRHAFRLPTVLIAEDGEDLPFDIAQMRTIFFDHRDLRSAMRCQEQIERQLRVALDGAADSPIATAVNVHELQSSGSSVERGIAELSARLDSLSQNVASVHNQVTQLASADLPDARQVIRIVEAITGSAGVRSQLHERQQASDEVAAHRARFDLRNVPGRTWAAEQKREIDDEFDRLMASLVVQEGSILIAEPLPRDDRRQPSHLVFLTVFGPAAPKIQQSRVRIEESIAGKVYAGGVPEISSRPYTDASFSPAVDKKGEHVTRNMLTIPLNYQGRRVAVAQFLNRAEPFDAADVQRTAQAAHTLAKMVSEFIGDLQNLEDIGLYSSLAVGDGTIMICDLSASAMLFRHYDPRLALRTVNEYLQRQSQVVLDYGGTIDKYLGDGAMYRFNVPERIADHDHGLRAVEAAHEMQRDFTVLKRAWEEELGEVGPLFSRIGIASGEIYTQVVGHQAKLQLTVMGPVVNQAFALCESAPRDRNVIVSDRGFGDRLRGQVATRVIDLEPGNPVSDGDDRTAYELLGD